MEQVKIFHDIPGTCEEEINRWLAENTDKEITRVLQSSATSGASAAMSGHLHVTIFYRKK